MSTSIERYDERLDRRIQRQAQLIARTNLVPALKNKPDEIEARLHVAAALGLPANAKSLMQMYEPRSGSIAFMTQLMVAKAHELGHDIDVNDEESDETVGVCYGRRAGSDRWRRFTFTIEQARKAGLVKKDVWQGYAPDMLQNRAASRAVKWIAPGALLGFDPVFEQTAVAEAAGEVEVIDSPEPVDVVDAEIVEEHLGEHGEDNAWLARFGQALEAVTPPGYTAREVEHAVICHATECETGDASKVHVDQHDAVKKAYVGLREGFLELQRTDNGTFLVEAQPPDAAA